jgi:hypothetical protein
MYLRQSDMLSVFVVKPEGYFEDNAIDCTHQHAQAK